MYFPIVSFIRDTLEFIMSEVKLNLARKWRSKNFEEIIGQDLLVRMLKNGLYLQQYFPVYLFSGQRGCGKTSTARVFGAALNCEQLDRFQKQPQQHNVPCLLCVSCKAMEQAKHPDFIEIDAASHTGVDNVRMLIDSAALMPLMGRKKIYLIDEVHMLSKAAFNALLKILEEPPPSVIFILATTDPQKIIETVRSRCFQLFFKPVGSQTLHERLRTVCEREDIAFDDAGLLSIVKQTEGSVRDALNLLEQIRFSSNAVTNDAVLKVLGHIEDQELVLLFSLVLVGSPQKLLRAIAHMQWKKFSAPIMWGQLLELVRTALWLHYDVTPLGFVEYHDEIKKILRNCSVKQLTLFLQTMYDQELLFSKTTSKHDFFEMILLQICQGMNKKSSSGGGSPSSAVQAPVVPDDDDMDEDDQDCEDDDDLEEEEEEQDEDALSCQWKQFIVAIDALKDPLINSIFVQGTIQRFDEKTGMLDVKFSKESTFFKQWLDDTQQLWFPLLKKIFGDAVGFTPHFTGAPVAKKKREPIVHTKPLQSVKPVATGSSAPAQSREFRKPFGRQTRSAYYKPFAQEVAIDISDTDVWSKTHMIMKHIPGTVKEIRG